MRATRFTSWLLISLLLMHGAGLFSALHNLSHHAQPNALSTACDHHHPIDSHQNSEQGSDDENPEPTPEPQDEDEHCSICLGLSGLHLIDASPQASVVVAPAFAERLTSEPRSIHGILFDLHLGARAPPIC